MCPVLVVVADVLVHQPLQMPYVQNDDVIQQIPSAIFHPAFGDAVLPRASEVDLLRSDAEAFHRADDLLVEVRSAIEDQIIRRCIVRKCFAQLLRDPQTTWMPGDVAVEGFEVMRMIRRGHCLTCKPGVRNEIRFVNKLFEIAA